MRAIFAKGGSGRWVPTAGVGHLVPAERQTVGYLRRYFALAGRTTAAQQGRAGRGRLLRRYLRCVCAYAVLRLTGNPRRWIGPLIEGSRVRGRLLSSR